MPSPSPSVLTGGAASVLTGPVEYRVCVLPALSAMSIDTQ